MIDSIFGVPMTLIGMLHLGALPGTPGSRGGVAHKPPSRKLQCTRPRGSTVSGRPTGCPTEPGEVRAVSEAVGIPVLVGSGITPGNLACFPAADALIVGSSVKQGGLRFNPLEDARVRAVARAFQNL